MASRLCTLSLSLAILTAPLGQAASPQQDAERFLLRGNVHPAVAQAQTLGFPDSAAPMERMILTLRVPPAAQARLDSLLAQQQDPTSPLYHRWLTPEAFGSQFGPSPQDLASVLAWLEQQGFVVEEVGAGRTSIVFSGDVQRVERAFQTQILDYQLEGRAFRANATEPSIPSHLAAVVHGVVSLHNLPRKAMNRGLQPVREDASRGEYTTGSSAHYLAPADFATIYNVNPLYKTGIDGTGVTIAIVGRTHISATDVTGFRSQFGLPANPPVFVVNGADPGDLGSGEDTEAALDVEWAGAIARNATVKFVMSRSTGTTDGVDLSALYIVNNNLAPIMSTSFGQCESALGSAENAFYNNLWAQAAAQGITSFVASGDSGAAGCSGGSASAGSGMAVSGLASTPYNVCVGGTQFNEAGGSYWSTANGAGQGSALGYIPEKAWNESASMGGSGLWATGGGASSTYAKPAWQVAPGVPADGRRDVPDVSLSAASHDGYLIQINGGLGAVGGTSASSPAFASIMALVVQSTGQRQGNANTTFYKLANAQFKGTGPAVFHDILTGSNTVPGASGYACGTGYDQATGLGSVDVQALVTNWSTSAATNKVTAAITTPSANLTVASGATTAFSGSATDSSATATLSYSWTFGDGASASGASASHAFTNTTTANASYTVTLTATDNTGVSASATRTITVTPAPRNTLTATIATPAASLTVASGAATSFVGTAKDSSATAAITYAWTFGDGTAATGATASHAFTNTTTANASYTVTLTATDNTGVTASATRSITVTPAPRNTLTAAIATPAASLTVASGAATSFVGTAKDSSATAAITYAWTFGDGTTATGATASHAFTNTTTVNATYTVTLTAKDSTGITATATRLITALPVPKNTLTATIATPAASLTVASGAATSFVGTAKDSSATAAITYAWTFGDGTAATGATASHAFTNTTTANATCTVTLTAKDSTGITATATRLITVLPVPKNTLTTAIATPAANLTVASGAATSFVGTAKDSSATAAITYTWAFGDGTSATGATASHAFTNTTTANATYTVTLTAKDSTGITATATRLITVLPVPKNTLTAAIATPAASLTVASGAATSFMGTAKDSSATAAITYTWAFGDGTSATGATASHAFTNSTTANATYTVTLTAKDSTGITATATRLVTVTPAPPALTVSIASPTANLTVASGSTVTLTGVATDTNVGATLSYNWTATPTTTAAARLQPMASPTSLSSVCTITLTNVGTVPYSVTVAFNVTDSRGAKATASRIITVTPVKR